MTWMRARSEGPQRKESVSQGTLAVGVHIARAAVFTRRWRFGAEHGVLRAHYRRRGTTPGACGMYSCPLLSMTSFLPRDLQIAVAHHPDHGGLAGWW